MPTGMFIRRRAENFFRKEYPHPVFKKCADWLSHLESTQGIEIQHARNDREYEVQLPSKKVKVDGFCKSNNSVYQFHGC